MSFKLFKKYQVVNKSKVARRVVLAGVLSCLVGGLVGIFSTPKSGSDSRKAVIKKSYQLGEQAKQNLDKALENTKEGTKEVGHKVHEVAQDVRGRLEQMVSNLRHEKAEAKAEVEASIDQAKHTIVKKAEDIKEKINDKVHVEDNDKVVNVQVKK